MFKFILTVNSASTLPYAFRFVLLKTAITLSYTASFFPVIIGSMLAASLVSAIALMTFVSASILYAIVVVFLLAL